MGASRTLAFTARLVIAETGLYSPGVVIVEGGLIKDVGPMGHPSEVAEFDVLAPGFCDLQVNGVGPIDIAVADGEDWVALGDALLEQGVTTWCPTLVTAPSEETSSACDRAAKAMREIPPGHPQIAGVHVEGPFITVPGAHRTEYVVARIDEQWVDRLSPVVRIVTLAPEVPGAQTAIPRLCEKGILVSLGHSSCSTEQAHDAISAGARLVTHLGNASGPFHQREPGLFGAALADDRVAVSLIADLEHVHADLLRLAFKAKGPGGVVLVTDAVAVAAGTVGPVELTAGRQPGSAARLSDGTLAGSVLTMDRAVGNVLTHAGMAIETAVKAASTTPARLLGLDDRGSISVGRRADLVAFSMDGLGQLPEHGVEEHGVEEHGVEIQGVEEHGVEIQGVEEHGVEIEAVWVGGRCSWRR
jgi:N-acetylglucosamine-6-phosphate deacetylase